MPLGQDEIEVFEAGDYTDHGAGVYTEDDLKEIADSYDPKASHEAPLTLDHVEEGPAYGWIEGLRVEGKRLIAKARQIAPALRDAVHDGRFRHVSSEIYRDFKGTGKPYLRAVSFLGAQVPKVKGLAVAQFAEGAGPWEKVDRRTRRTEGGTMEKDRKRSAREVIREETKRQTADAFAEEREKLNAQLEAANQKVAAAEAEVAKLSESVAVVRRESTLNKLGAVAEKWVRDRLLTPASVDKGVVSFMEAISAVEFERPAQDKAAGTEKVKAIEFFAEVLRDRVAVPPVFDGENTRDLEDVDVSKLTDAGRRVPVGADRDSVAFSEKVSKLAASEKITWEEASRRIARASGYTGQARK